MGRLLRRLRRAIARHGVYGSAVLALRVLLRVPRYTLRALEERRYDRRHGVDTRGLVRHGELGMFSDGLHYQGTSPRLFREVLDELPVARKELTFIDIGCGKGRTLLLAAQFGFRHVVGVELSEELAQTARENLRAVGIDGEVHTVDAAHMEFPDGPLVVYLYNPFGEATVKVVLDNLRRSLSERPRDTFVIYVNPLRGATRDLIRLVLDADDFASVASGRDWVTVRALTPAVAEA